MSSCGIPEAELGYCFGGAVDSDSGDTCNATVRNGFVGCGSGNDIMEGCRDAACNWDGQVCFNVLFAPGGVPPPMDASDVAAVNARVGDLRREMQELVPSLTQRDAAGSAANTLQLVNDRLSAIQGSMPGLLSDGTIRESVGMCTDVLMMRTVVGDRTNLDEQETRSNFTRGVELIARMAHAAGPAAIRSASQSNPPLAATGADFYVPDSSGDGTGLELALIVQANSASAAGWSRSITVGNVVVNATQASFSSVALEAGEELMLSVTRYGASESTNDLFPPGSGHTDDLLPSVVSVVLPAAEEGTSTNLDAPISIRFSDVLQSNESNASSSGPTCKWWDYGASDGSGGWNATGCTTAPVDGIPGSYDCQCTHLTHFAVLFEQDSDESSRSSDEEASLVIVTFVGIGLGLVGVLATVLVLRSARSLVELPQMILAAMLCTHALMLITFLAAVDRSNHSSDVSCTLVAYMLHYLLVSTMAWMICEGWHLYHRFVQVMGVDETFSKFALFGWGFPLVWVAIGGAGFGDDYGTDDLCWIASGSPALYLVIVPVGMTIVINGFVFWVVMRVIATAQSDKGVAAATQVKAVVTFASTLGLFYVFAILVFATGHVVFQYLLALTATSQGIVVFYFHIWRRPDFRDHIGRCWRIVRTGDSRKANSRSAGSSATDSSRKTAQKSGGKVGRMHTDWRDKTLAKTSTAADPDSVVYAAFVA
jgi:hypothetical protein